MSFMFLFRFIAYKKLHKGNIILCTWIHIRKLKGEWYQINMKSFACYSFVNDEMTRKKKKSALWLQRRLVCHFDQGMHTYFK